ARTRRLRLGAFGTLLDQPAGVVEDAGEAVLKIGVIGGPNAVTYPGHLGKQRSGSRIDGNGVLDGAGSHVRRLVLLVEPRQYHRSADVHRDGRVGVERVLRR